VDLGTLLLKLVYLPSSLTDARSCLQLCKALLVRNHPSALEFIHRLFDVFVDPTIGTDAAKAFGDIAASDSVLTKRNGAIVKVCLLLLWYSIAAWINSRHVVPVGPKVRYRDLAPPDEWCQGR
jgi:hypothetical protein